MGEGNGVLVELAVKLRHAMSQHDRGHHQNFRHAGMLCLPYQLAHALGDLLRRGVEARLAVVCAQHDDYARQRIVALQQQRKSVQTAAVFPVPVVELGGSPAESLFDDPLSKRAEQIVQKPRPACLVVKTAVIPWVQTPRIGIAKAKNRLHVFSLLSV